MLLKNLYQIKCCALVIIALTAMPTEPVSAQSNLTKLTPEQAQLMIGRFDKIIAATPKDPDMYYIRASVKMLSSDFDGALQDLAQSRDLGTKKYEYEVYSGLGTCYLMRNDFSEAMVNYNRALSLKPFEASAYVNRGGCYARMGHYRESIADYNQAIKLNSSDGDAYSGIGECYCRCGQYAYAIQYLNKAIARDRENFEAYFYRGTAYQKLGQPQVAARDFAEAKRLGWEPGKIYMHPAKQ